MRTGDELLAEVRKIVKRKDCEALKTFREGLLPDELALFSGQAREIMAITISVYERLGSIGRAET